MLTADLVRPRLRQRGSELTIDLVRLDDRRALRTARELIQLFAQHEEKTREDWENALQDYEGSRVDYDFIRGLAKVLADQAEYAPDEFPHNPADVRHELFAQGPVFDRPMLFQPQSRDDVLAAAAQQLDMDPARVEEALFADRPAAYRMVDPGPAWTPESLLARYNLELSRAVLYWAREMDVELHDTFKDFWSYLKLFKLMFWARPLEGGGYHVALDGPISPFVRSTTRYGRQFAAFLPALLLCSEWQMQAVVRPSGFDSDLTYRLDSTAQLPSVFKSSGSFDSRMEADFAGEFHDKFGDERAKWVLNREDEVLILGDVVFIPDFSLTNEKDGRRALIEIVGFWHPEYLKRKLKKVRQAGRDDMLLLVYEGVNLSDEQLEDVPGEVLYFVNKPILKDVMVAIERIAQ